MQRQQQGETKGFALLILKNRKIPYFARLTSLEYKHTRRSVIRTICEILQLLEVSVWLVPL